MPPVRRTHAPKPEAKPQTDVVDGEFTDVATDVKVETGASKGELAVIPEKSIVRQMANRYHMEAVAFQHAVMDTCFPLKAGERQINAAEFAGFLLIAFEHGLNPIRREIYGFKAKNGAIVPVVGVDGWMNIINQRKEMDGIEFDEHFLDDANPAKDIPYAITARIHRKDRSHPTVVTEYMAECRRDTGPWQQWPRRMLRHKTAIQCARIAFSFSGIYDPDEAERMGIDVSAMTDVTPRNGQSAPPASKLAPPDMRPPAPKTNAPASPPADQGTAPAASTPSQPDVSSGNTNPDPETKGPAGAGTPDASAKTATGPAIARAKAAQEAAKDDGPIPDDSDDNGLIPNPAQEPSGFLTWLEKELAVIEDNPNAETSFEMTWIEAETALAKEGVDTDTKATADEIARKHEKRLGLGG